MVLALLAAVVAPAGAQYPRARVGEFEVRGFDYAPDGAWRRNALQVMQARRALLGAHHVALLNGGGKPAVRGNYFVPVIPIAYRDVPPPFSTDRYQ
ncbi:MAG: hypothetical protein ACREK8_02360, partial [Gemmatimonadales bacterium]